jgi:hypothetical protein|tara:strand:- start:218 stop:364 length:147 start_codon:yes stop_codon:yes gene_type:complete
MLDTLLDNPATFLEKERDQMIEIAKAQSLIEVAEAIQDLAAAVREASQ